MSDFASAYENSLDSHVKKSVILGKGSIPGVLNLATRMCGFYLSEDWKPWPLVKRLSQDTVTAVLVGFPLLSENQRSRTADAKAFVHVHPFFCGLFSMSTCLVYTKPYFLSTSLGPFPSSVGQSLLYYRSVHSEEFSEQRSEGTVPIFRNNY